MKTAVVIGGTSGIGAGICEVLADAGWSVVTTGVTQQEVDHFLESRDSVRPSVAAEPLDVTKGAAVKEFFGGLPQLDGLVNCAGILRRGEEYDIEVFQQVIDVNLTGQFLCAREAVKAFKRQGINREVSYAAGKIIHMSSVHDIIPWEGHVNYAAAEQPFRTHPNLDLYVHSESVHPRDNFGCTSCHEGRGRAIDFVSREPEAPPEVAEFMRFHDWSVRLESGKMLAILGAVVVLVRRPRG